MSLILPHNGTGRSVVSLPAGFLKSIAAFADVAGNLHWGLHCSDCQQDIVGHNARHETHWVMECGCRTYHGESAPTGPRN